MAIMTIGNQYKSAAIHADDDTFRNWSYAIRTLLRFAQSLSRDYRLEQVFIDLLSLLVKWPIPNEETRAKYQQRLIYPLSDILEWCVVRARIRTCFVQMCDFFLLPLIQNTSSHHMHISSEWYWVKSNASDRAVIAQPKPSNLIRGRTVRMAK